MTEQLEHTVATELLIVISQTVFFVFLFLILKYGIVDRQGWMEDKDKVKENIIPLTAVFFAILTIISVIMIPLQYYEYGHVVLITTMISIFLIFLYEFRKLYYSDEINNKDKSTNVIVKASRDIFVRNHNAVVKKASKPPRSQSSSVHDKSSDSFDF